eukprot:8980167-Pyramimonas_sp.AAC.2
MSLKLDSCSLTAKGSIPPRKAPTNMAAEFQRIHETGCTMAPVKRSFATRKGFRLSESGGTRPSRGRNPTST